MMNKEMVVNKKKLSIDYPTLLGEDWAEVLKNPLLDTEYMENLMIFLHEAYKVSTNIFPKKADIFKPLKTVRLKDVRVVIVGTEPYTDGNATGIPLANEDVYGKVYHPALNAYLKGIERTVYDGINLSVDSTLEEVTSQGVLFIDSAFTSSGHKEFAHLLHWRNFVRELVKVISEYVPGAIFCFWGPEAQYFKKYVGYKNYMFMGEHPSQAAKEKRRWENDNPVKVNELLESVNGKGHQIIW